jgi:hypothetical protein
LVRKCRSLQATALVHYYVGNRSLCEHRTRGDRCRSSGLGGEALSRELGWEIRAKSGAQFSQLYVKLSDRYLEALRKADRAAARVRAASLAKFKSPLVDVSPDIELSSVNRDAYLKMLTARPIRHANKSSEEWTLQQKAGEAIPKDSWRSYEVDKTTKAIRQIQVGPIFGNETWPPILGSEEIWGIISSTKMSVDWEILGFGRLDTSYVAFLTDPTYVALGGATIFFRANPKIEYIVTIPRTVAQNDKLRTLLFGRSTPGPHSDDELTPFVTSENALSLVLWPDFDKAKASPEKPPQEPNAWNKNVFLEGLESGQGRNVEFLLRQIELTTSGAASAPQPQAVVSEELRQLELLKQIKDERS